MDFLLNTTSGDTEKVTFVQQSGWIGTS